LRVASGGAVPVTVQRPGSAAASQLVEFRQMDPCCLAPDLGSFDVVVLDDCLDKLISPKAPLARMGGVHPLVKPGGALLHTHMCAMHAAASSTAALPCRHRPRGVRVRLGPGGD
jgi:hypothetical protein